MVWSISHGARDCDGPAIIGATWVVVTLPALMNLSEKKCCCYQFTHFLRIDREKVLKVKPYSILANHILCNTCIFQTADMIHQAACSLTSMCPVQWRVGQDQLTYMDLCYKER